MVSHSQIEKAKQKLQEIQKSREALNKLTQSNTNTTNSTSNVSNAKKEISEVKKQEQEIKRHENIKRRTGFRVIKRNDETENEIENSVTESKKPTQSTAAIFEDIKKEWQEKDKQETKKLKNPVSPKPPPPPKTTNPIKLILAMRGILRAMIFMMMKPMKSYCLICMNKIISIRKKKKKKSAKISTTGCASKEKTLG